jgi:hypothetical protein
VTIKKRYGAYAFFVACLCLSSTLIFQNCAKSEYGNEETASLIARTTAFDPNSVSIKINSQAAYTNISSVQLSLAATNAIEMLVSNSSSCNDPADRWEAFSTQKSWILSAQNSNVKVYAKFRGSSGDESACVSASIVHDNISPTLAFSSTPALVSNLAKSDFLFSHSDSVSGIDQALCRFDAGPDSPCVAGSSFSQVLLDGAHKFTLTVKDKAGNSASLTYDWTIASTASGAFVVQGITSIDPTKDVNVDAFLGQSLTPKVQWQASSGAVSYRISILDSANAFACAEVNAGNSLNYSFPAGNCTLVSGQSYTAKVVALNAANVQQTASFAFKVDNTAPTINIGNITTDPATGNTTANFTVSDSVAGLNTVSCVLSQNNVVIKTDNCLNLTNFKYVLSAGTYKFQITASDKVGNSLTDPGKSLSMQIYVCDPFSVANGTNCANGLKGKLTYQTSAPSSVVTALGAGGIDTGADFRMSHLFVPTNQTIPGLKSRDGSYVKTMGGATIVDLYAIEVSGFMKLGAADSAGAYDFAIIADDGAILSLNNQQYINIDGLHSAVLGCNQTTPIQLDANSRLPINLKFYQGSLDASLNVLYRKRANPGVYLAEPNCLQYLSFYGVNNFSPVPSAVTHAELCALSGTPYAGLCARGWKPLGPENLTQ